MKTTICIILAIMLSWFPLQAIADEDESIVLYCKVPKWESPNSTDFALVLHPIKREVDMFDGNYKKGVVGDLVIEDHQYLLKFNKTEEAWEKRFKINRYSGDMEYEFGGPPFFTSPLNKGNLRFYGHCKLGKRLF